MTTPNKLSDINFCVTRGRKLVYDQNYEAIPELIRYVEEYTNSRDEYLRLYQEDGLERHNILVKYKQDVIDGILESIEALNRIRVSKEKANNFENDSFQEEVTKTIKNGK